MSIRPFYIVSEIDGRKTPLKGGPRSKDGCMKVNIYIRDNGGIEKAYTLSCYPGDDKDLIVSVLDNNGKVVHKTKSVY